MAAALEANKTLEEISVGNVIVGSTVRLKSDVSMRVVTGTGYSPPGSVTLQGVDGFPDPSKFDPIPAVLPLKKLRDNTITELDLKNSGLGVDGGMMLAAMLKSNNSVTKVSDDWCDKRLRCCSINLIHKCAAISMVSCSAYCLFFVVFDA